MSLRLFAQVLLLGAALSQGAPVRAEQAFSVGLSSHHTWLHSDYTPGFGLTVAHRKSSDGFFVSLTTHSEADLGLNVDGDWYVALNQDLVGKLDVFVASGYFGVSVGTLARSTPSTSFRLDPTLGFVLGGESRSTREFGVGATLRYDFPLLDLGRTTGPLRLNLYLNFY